MQRHLALVLAAAACSRAQPGVPHPAVPPVEGQWPLSLGHSVLPRPGRWHCSSTLRQRFLSASAGAQKSIPLQCPAGAVAVQGELHSTEKSHLSGQEHKPSGQSRVLCSPGLAQAHGGARRGLRRPADHPHMVLGTHHGGTGVFVRLKVRHQCQCAGHTPVTSCTRAGAPCFSQHRTLVTLAVDELRPWPALCVSHCPPAAAGHPPGMAGDSCSGSHTSCWQECQSSHFEGRKVERRGLGADL